MNMASMRWVTMNPPKMFTDASAMPARPNPVARVRSPGPAASSAPTMMTDDTALVTAINGECSAGVTRQTTW